MGNKVFPPRGIWVACFIIFCFLWGCSAARHSLLQSNAYDLGLFDQWIWLASKGLPAISSMERVHLLADHGAFSLYVGAIAYRIHGSVQWLFASQAACLSLTAIPIWFIGKQAGLNKKLCWMACGLWWLQPVVFNTNLFDFHPEVWAMPALAGCYWANREKKAWLWFVLLVLLLSCRDGLVLVVAGIGLENAWRRKWIWAVSATGLALGWLAILNRVIYPFLTGNYEGPKAVKILFSYLGESFDEVILNLLTKPQLLLEKTDALGGIEYLLLLSIAIAPFWRKASFPTLIGGFPLVMVNLLSQASPQRSLIHHYSLPIAVVVVVAAIDGLAMSPKQEIPWKRISWNAVCWAALAKPWFFTGPYLERLGSISDAQSAFNSVPSNSKVITTSYLVPHLSHRVEISFPKDKQVFTSLENIDAILLNPNDPGWGSSQAIQEKLLKKAKGNGWECKAWKNGLELCKIGYPRL